MITTDAGNISISFNIAHEWRNINRDLNDIQSQSKLAIDRLLDGYISSILFNCTLFVY